MEAESTIMTLTAVDAIITATNDVFEKIASVSVTWEARNHRRSVVDGAEGENMEMENRDNIDENALFGNISGTWKSSMDGGGPVSMITARLFKTTFQFLV